MVSRMAASTLDNVVRRIREIEKDLLGIKDRQLEHKEVREFNLSEYLSCRTRVFEPLSQEKLQVPHVGDFVAKPTNASAWLQSLKVGPGQGTGRPLVVLSLFDGIGGVWAALDMLGIPYRGYSSEIVSIAALQLEKLDSCKL